MLKFIITLMFIPVYLLVVWLMSACLYHLHLKKTDVYMVAEMFDSHVS